MGRKPGDHLSTGASLPDRCPEVCNARRFAYSQVEENQGRPGKGTDFAAFLRQFLSVAVVEEGINLRVSLGTRLRMNVLD